MYLNEMGFCGIERVKGVAHTTVIYNEQTNYQILSQCSRTSRNSRNYSTCEKRNFYRLKKNVHLVVDSSGQAFAGILSWVLGNRSAATFNRLGKIVKCWHSFWSAINGYIVYKMFVADDNQIISSKT